MDNNLTHSDSSQTVAANDSALVTLRTVIIDDEQLAREELKYLLETASSVEILAEGRNGIEAVQLVEKHHPDVLFLDVQMPGLDGFAVLRHLIENKRSLGLDRLPLIVFATAFDNYAVKAFDVNAVDYLLKPFDQNRVLQALDRARARLLENGIVGAEGLLPGRMRAVAQQPRTELVFGDSVAVDESLKGIDSEITTLLEMLQRQQAVPFGSSAPNKLPSKLIVQVQSRLLLIDQADICYAAIEDGAIRIVTPKVEGQSKCRTLEELMDLLDPNLFWRAHRGFIVSINHIKEVVPWFKSSYQLRMDDKKQTEIPVSRAQTRRLRELFNL